MAVLQRFYCILYLHFIFGQLNVQGFSLRAIPEKNTWGGRWQAIYFSMDVWCGKFSNYMGHWCSTKSNYMGGWCFAAWKGKK